MDAWWRAANYLSVGQIYLLDNPLLERPLGRSDIKPRLLAIGGRHPASISSTCISIARSRRRGLDMIYICGPGHGGPGMVANTWLQGTYSEIYPNIPQTKDGMRRLFKQFSFPGGIPSHAAPETPGSIHEGGRARVLAVARLRRGARQP
jgi:xylulose-5-phosphate/fructose-6-phosphate phosphoketolase